jgi:hypothetical protein
MEGGALGYEAAHRRSGHNSSTGVLNDQPLFSGLNLHRANFLSFLKRLPAVFLQSPIYCEKLCGNIQSNPSARREVRCRTQRKNGSYPES